MTVEYRTGDLFAQGFRALAHGCNCRGVMGAGIAREFRRRWPAMYNTYRKACQDRLVQPGDMLPWQAPDGTMIYNLATQDRPGPHATLQAIRTSVAVMLNDAEHAGIDRIGLPRIGAGIGGLPWPDVTAVLEDIAGSSPVRLVVVSLPGA
ncbi:hypothetical protein GCM10010172_80320 [Paractinoplanes ferrugineus]|uniref:Macro domain-containing protein n=1 Tax=Paractinoplanes ferrugineus TaxID=113564 RepID=A0A919JCE3_9ACTN|nr:macro domain-containing protein [Actinoplanes ferrugineus]GIE16749.1 hypothetical protein Afe05nite_85890 [Actinoplanes ferrugineus]